MTSLDPPAATDARGDRRAWRNVIVLVLAQAILGAQLSIHLIVGGLAGVVLAPSPLLATLPVSVMVFSSMTTAPWLSPLMQRRGRVTGFVIGSLAGAAGGLLAAYAVWAGSFALLLAALYLVGIYQSAQGFYRFAATDAASDGFKPKAISYVLAGGLLSAFVGPAIVKATTGGAAGALEFVPTYVGAGLLSLVGLVLFPLLDLPRAAPKAAGAPAGRTRGQLLRDPAIVVAIVCAMVSYALMTLVMTSTPLAVVGCGFATATAADVVQWHVIAMFGPSFFTGHLIARFGTTAIVSAGLGLLAAAGAVALSGVELWNFYAALVLLGLGWNFGFIGATTMLTRSHAPEERGTVQGLNDALVFGLVTVASLSSGGLMGAAPEVVAGWSAVNLAMVPFLALAGGSLVWLAVRGRRAA
ncbi:MFS transporter [Jannaschia sp. Os4]|uniref:MFS transporter n=1 Tax=Jannaschia sp. Os4 TaxID=2807617 RepID=UPI00193A19F2|nr:MFS transporter [Jannaschia sp. Os4]MBM2577994.1 MFS transporter [Jannaschia sp. Os4]